jgi:hypothetical protein
MLSARFARPGLASLPDELARLFFFRQIHRPEILPGRFKLASDLSSGDVNHTADRRTDNPQWVRQVSQTLSVERRLSADFHARLFIGCGFLSLHA